MLVLTPSFIRRRSADCELFHGGIGSARKRGDRLALTGIAESLSSRNRATSSQDRVFLMSRGIGNRERQVSRSVSETPSPSRRKSQSAIIGDIHSRAAPDLEITAENARMIGFMEENLDQSADRVPPRLPGQSRGRALAFSACPDRRPLETVRRIAWSNRACGRSTDEEGEISVSSRILLCHPQLRCIPRP